MLLVVVTLAVSPVCMEVGVTVAHLEEAEVEDITVEEVVATMVEVVGRAGL